LPDTPPSVGLPEVEGTERHSEKHESPAEFRKFVVKQVFLNKYIWIVSLANFFVYIIRYAVLDWRPTLLTESKHVVITHAGWIDEHLRLREHSAFRLGSGRVSATLRLGRRLCRINHRRCHRYAAVHCRVAGQGRWL